MSSALKRANFNCFKSFSRRYSNTNGESCYDVAIVGGGIVGSSTAREIKLKKPHLNCVLIEKEKYLGRHQSSHNSGVIHAGIYYAPGSMRAKLCTQGMALLYDYLDAKRIPYKKVGKLIVATDMDQAKILKELFFRGQENKVPDLRMIPYDEICTIEPYCVGVSAIHSPNTGIVDYGRVTKFFGYDFLEAGGVIMTDFEVNSIKIAKESCMAGSCDIEKYPIELTSKKGQKVNAGYVLTCAGLHSDRVSKMYGGYKHPAILPFRGEYLQLIPEKTCFVRGNIYPVPDPKLPFLGVHITPRMDGSVWLGPNAVLAFKREGYKYSDISVGDLCEMLCNRGFHKLAAKHLAFGIQENMKSVIWSMQVKELQKFIPFITVKDVMRGTTGVRAQAIQEDGTLIEDFVFDEGGGDRVLHCRNAPSPAATASLAIARVLADVVFKKLSKLC